MSSLDVMTLNVNPAPGSLDSVVSRMSYCKPSWLSGEVVALARVIGVGRRVDGCRWVEAEASYWLVTHPKATPASYRATDSMFGT